jgi:hypothetical protein
VAVLLDTLKLADRLEAAGLPPQQAHDMAAAFAETIAGDLVTRQDLQLAVAELKSDVRGWLITQAFAIIGAVGVLIAVAAAVLRLLH